MEDNNGKNTITSPIVLWDKISALKQVASSTLPVQKEKVSPNREKARKDYLFERARLAEALPNTRLQEKVNLARQRMEELNQKNVDESCRRLFDGMMSIHPQSRMAMAYRYILGNLVELRPKRHLTIYLYRNGRSNIRNLVKVQLKEDDQSPVEKEKI